jgi:hypothetical protein
MCLVIAGGSALTSAAALSASTGGSLDLEPALMAASGLALLSAGVPMWVSAAPGRQTRPNNPELMYVGLVLAGVGLATLPPSSALLAASFDETIDGRDTLRTTAIVAGAAAHAFIAAGIPMWAKGAASPDDRHAGITLGLGGLRGRF